MGGNIAWGYQDPFRGWYDFEKKKYDNGTRDMSVIGHYINLTDSTFKACGFACMTGGEYGSEHVQTFFYMTSDAMSVDQYEARFMDYYNMVKNGGSSTVDTSAIDRLNADLQQAFNEKNQYENDYSATESRLKNDKITLMKGQLQQITSQMNIINRQLSELEPVYLQKKEDVEQGQKILDTLNTELKELEQAQSELQEKKRQEEEKLGKETEKETEKETRNTSESATDGEEETTINSTKQKTGQVRFVEDDADKEEKESGMVAFFKKWKYFILAEGAILVAVIVGIFVAVRKKKRKNKTPAGNGDKNETMRDETK